MSNINKADWPVRKIVYYVVGIVLFVAVTAGWVTEDQIETALSTGERVTAYLAAAGLVSQALRPTGAVTIRTRKQTYSTPLSTAGRMTRP